MPDVVCQQSHSITAAGRKKTLHASAVAKDQPIGMSRRTTYTLLLNHVLPDIMHMCQLAHVLATDVIVDFFASRGPLTESRLSRIGLLSDSHGRAQTTRLAAQRLVEHGAQLLIHLGDIGSVEVIDAFAGLIDPDGHIIPARLVFGNTDWDAPSLHRYAKSIDVIVDHPAGRLDLDLTGTPNASPGNPQASQLIFTHGDDPGIMENALAQQVRYLCHGHTHRAADTREGATRIINPGALFRAHEYTVAILDVENDQLAFYPVGGV